MAMMVRNAKERCSKMIGHIVMWSTCILYGWQHVTSEAEHSHSLYRPASHTLYIYIWSWFALISRFCVSICIRICICRNDILLLLLWHHYIFVVCYCYRYHYNRKAEMKCFVDLCLMEIHHCRVEWSEGWNMLMRVFVNGGCYSVGLQEMLSMH